jgi:hypothetical protein
MKIAFIGCGYALDIDVRTQLSCPELAIRGVFDVDMASP